MGDKGIADVLELRFAQLQVVEVAVAQLTRTLEEVKDDVCHFQERVQKLEDQQLHVLRFQVEFNRLREQVQEAVHIYEAVMKDHEEWAVKIQVLQESVQELHFDQHKWKNELWAQRQIARKGRPEPESLEITVDGLKNSVSHLLEQHDWLRKHRESALELQKSFNRLELRAAKQAQQQEDLKTQLQTLTGSEQSRKQSSDEVENEAMVDAGAMQADASAELGEQRGTTLPSAALPAENVSPAALPAENVSPANIRIAITVVKALKLPELGKGDIVDPFCTCEIIGKPATRFETEVLANTSSPEWNYTHEISEYVINNSLRFSVWDEDPDGQKILCEAELKTWQFYPCGFEGELVLMLQGNDAPQDDPPTLDIKVELPELRLTGDEVDSAGPRLAGSREASGKVVGTCSLKVTVCGADRLPSTDHSGLADPFCTCMVPGKPNQRFRTPVIETTNKPEWNYSRMFTKFYINDPLCFLVFDTHPDGEELIGQIMLMPNQFYPQDFDGEMNLQPAPAFEEDEDQRYSAVLHVQVSVLHANVQKAPEEDWEDEEPPTLETLWSAIENQAEANIVTIMNYISQYDWNARNDQGHTLLHRAAHRGHSLVCRLLLNKDTFTAANAKDNDGWTALHWAAFKGSALACIVILEHQKFMDPGALDFIHSWTALHIAARYGHPEACAAILSSNRFQDLDVRARDVDWWTALHCAAAYGHKDACSVLLEHPRFTAIDAQNVNGQTARDIAHGAAREAFGGLTWY